MRQPENENLHYTGHEIVTTTFPTNFPTSTRPMFILSPREFVITGFMVLIVEVNVTA